MKTNKTIIMLVLGIFLIASVLAVYPGETIIEEHNLGSDNLVYTIIDNSTIIPPLDVSVNLTHIIINFPYDMPVDDFKIVFMEEQTKEVVKEVVVYRSSGSSGGSRTKYIYKNVTEYVEVEVEKIVNNTIEVEVEKELSSETDTEVKEKNNSVIILIILITIILTGLIFLYSKLRVIMKSDYGEKEREDIH
jgi:hypothetical protein